MSKASSSLSGRSAIFGFHRSAFEVGHGDEGLTFNLIDLANATNVRMMQ